MNKIMVDDVDITVAIPTYNGAERLPIILEKLFYQKELENINWEIIIVDNNSTDTTALIVKNYQKIFKNICPVRYFLEIKQGAAFARLRAVEEAKGKLVAFLDDDNLPDSHWVSEAYIFGLEYPNAGAWSGQIHGDFEVKPPDNFQKIQAFLAIREHGDEPQLFHPENLQLPPGAALVVRKQVWSENVPKIPSLSGKLPGILVQGDDYEPLLYIHNAGWEIWYNPTMHSYHQIPQWRLEKEYLLTLARGCGLCIFQLRLITAKNWQKPLIFIKTIIGNFRRIINHLIKYNLNIKNDLIALFEIQFYFGSMISPFYITKRYLKRVLHKIKFAYSNE